MRLIITLFFLIASTQLGLLLPANALCVLRLEVEAGSSPLVLDNTNALVNVKDGMKFESASLFQANVPRGFSGILYAISPSLASCPPASDSAAWLSNWPTFNLTTDSPFSPYDANIFIYPSIHLGQTVLAVGQPGKYDYNASDLHTNLTAFAVTPVAGQPGSFTANWNAAFTSGYLVTDNLVTSARRDTVAGTPASATGAPMRVEVQEAGGVRTLVVTAPQLALKYQVVGNLTAGTSVFNSFANFTTTVNLTAKAVMGCPYCGDFGRCASTSSGASSNTNTNTSVCECDCGWSASGGQCVVPWGYCAVNGSQSTVVAPPQSPPPPPSAPPAPVCNTSMATLGKGTVSPVNGVCPAGYDWDQYGVLCSACPAGFSGSDCMMCSSDSACKNSLGSSTAQCSLSPLYRPRTQQKHYTCDLLDRSLASIVGATMDFTCSTTKPVNGSIDPSRLTVGAGMLDTNTPIGTTPYCALSFRLSGMPRDAAVECTGWACRFAVNSSRVSCPLIKCACPKGCSNAEGTITESTFTGLSGSVQIACGAEAGLSSTDADGTSRCTIALGGLPIASIPASCKTTECIDPVNGTVSVTAENTSEERSPVISPIIAWIPYMVLLLAAIATTAAAVGFIRTAGPPPATATIAAAASWSPGLPPDSPTATEPSPRSPAVVPGLPPSASVAAAAPPPPGGKPVGESRLASGAEDEADPALISSPPPPPHPLPGRLLAAPVAGAPGPAGAQVAAGVNGGQGTGSRPSSNGAGAGTGAGVAGAGGGGLRPSVSGRAGSVGGSSSGGQAVPVVATESGGSGQTGAYEWAAPAEVQKAGLAAAGQDRPVVQELSWHDLRLSTQPRRSLLPPWRLQPAVTLLDGVSGRAASGEILGILGPSGSGKTTLLRVLAGLIQPGLHWRLDGEVRLDGRRLAAPRHLAALVGHVPQHDLLGRSLTVAECVAASAALRLSWGELRRGRAHVQARVVSVLRELHIAHLANRVVWPGGGAPQSTASCTLSGGERLRVSAALELVSDPPLLLLDEPLSGLDSATARATMTALRAVAAGGGGRVLVMSLHQPSPALFSSLDAFVLMVAGGRAAAGGAPAGVAAALAAVGAPLPPPDVPVADHLLDLVVTDAKVAARMCQLYGSSSSSSSAGGGGGGGGGGAAASSSGAGGSDADNYVRSLVHRRGGGGGAAARAGRLWLELGVLTWRSGLDMLRNPLMAALHVVVSGLIGLLVGAVFSDTTLDLSGAQNRVGSIFFSVMLLACFATSAVDAVYPERAIADRDLLRRSHGVLPYVAAKLVLDGMMLRALPAWAFGLPFYWLMGLRSSASAFFTFLGAFTTMSCLAGAACVTLCFTFSSPGRAVLVLNLLLLISALFAGFLANTGSIVVWLRWIVNVSPVRYCWSALVVNELEPLVLNFSSPDLPQGLPAVKGSLFLSLLGVDTGMLTTDLAVLGCMYAILAIAAATAAALRGVVLRGAWR